MKLRRLLSAFAFASAGLMLFILFGGLIYYGRPYAFFDKIFVAQPLPYFAGGVACLIVANAIFFGLPEDKPAWTRVVFRSLLLCISSIIALIAGEMVFRYVLKRAQQQNTIEALAHPGAAPRLIRSSHPLAAIVQVSADPKLGYELQRNLNMEFGHRTLRTNDDGLRESKDYAVEKDTGTLRIIGIGDSGMWGWNCNQDRAYMDILEQELQKESNGTRYEVISLAVPGYNTRLEYESLRVKGLKYRPDIVVVGWCVNDFEKPFFMLKPEDILRKDISYLHALAFSRSQMRNLVGGYRVSDHRDFRASNPNEPLAGPLDIQDAIAAVDDLQSLCKQEGIHLLFFGALNDRIEPILYERSIEYVNTRAEVDPTPYPEEWYIHDIHPREDGHRVLGEHLLKQLKRRNWLGRRPLDSDPTGSVPAAS